MLLLLPLLLLLAVATINSGQLSEPYSVFRSSFTARRHSTLARSVRVRLGFGSFFLDADVGQLACCTGRSFPCCSCCCFSFSVTTTRVSKTWRSRATERGTAGDTGGRQVGNAICRLSTAEASTGGRRWEVGRPKLSTSQGITQSQRPTMGA